MVKKFKYFLIFLLIFSANDLYLQDGGEIGQKKSELSQIKNEIQSLEKELQDKTSREKESFAVIENYNRQNFLLNKMINQLRAEEQAVEQKIKLSQNEIKSLEKEIEILKENYEKYVIAIYKYGKLNELAGIFDSESIDQALVRYKYLQRFSEMRQKDLSEFEENKQKLSAAKIKLESDKKEKEILTGQKIKEENELTAKLGERQKILKAVRNDKAALKKELDAKKNAEIKIQSLITKIIEEEERKRKEEEMRLAALEKNKSGEVASNIKTENTPPEIAGYDFDLSTSGFSSFASLKGKLNWPINGGNIIRKFGEHKNALLNTVTLNYGVDIKASSDHNVKAVAEGVVSAIDWIPGYGSVIILTHKGNYRTVYSHLAEIFVKEGDKVKPGSLLAKVGESLEGFVLHFEIWNSRNNQNPEQWLARK
jgi:murein hydrolase activator